MSRKILAAALTTVTLSTAFMSTAADAFPMEGHGLQNHGVRHHGPALRHHRGGFGGGGALMGLGIGLGVGLIANAIAQQQAQGAGAQPMAPPIPQRVRREVGRDHISSEGRAIDVVRFDDGSYRRVDTSPDGTKKTSFGQRKKAPKLVRSQRLADGGRLNIFNDPNTGQKFAQMEDAQGRPVNVTGEINGIPFR
jgi:hypothetical protein